MVDWAAVGHAAAVERGVVGGDTPCLQAIGECVVVASVDSAVCCVTGLVMTAGIASSCCRLHLGAGAYRISLRAPALLS